MVLPVAVIVHRLRRRRDAGQAVVDGWKEEKAARKTGRLPVFPPWERTSRQIKRQIADEVSTCYATRAESRGQASFVEFGRRINTIESGRARCPRCGRAVTKRRELLSKPEQTRDPS